MRITLLPVLVGSAILLGAGYGVTVVAPTADATAAGDETPVYSVHEAKGRGVYAGAGCVYCHTMQVRDTYTDAGLGGRPTTAEETLHDRPGLLGETRYGPDLACVGDRVEEGDEEERVDAMVEYLRRPAAAHPGSTMPSYDHLSDLDLHRLAAYLLAQTCAPEAGE